jgi:3'-5' exoribonuclease
MLNQLAQRGTSLTPEPLLISELQVNADVRGWLFAIEVQTRQAKNGKSFRQLRLRDQRGNEIKAIQFDLPRLETLAPQEGKAVLLEGVVEEYHNEIQIKLTNAEADSSASPDLFIVGTRRRIELLENLFQELMSKVNHPGLHRLLLDCFTTKVMERFRHWPAAVRHHGAVVGGLLEHTVNVTLIADRLTQLYTSDQSLVLAGARLHDIGKLEELEEQVGLGFTAAGRMFGHIVLGMRYVQDQTRQVAELDEATRQDLLHIILAHHGTQEFGSPICPATIEALIVHQADVAEAKLTGFLDHCDRTSHADGWSSYSSAFGGQLRMP